MKTCLFILMPALISLTALAGQEGIGGGLCDYAKIVCESPNYQSRDGEIVVCIFDNNRALVDITGASNGFYTVAKESHDPNLIGAPLRYSGQDMALQIEVDTPPHPQGILSYLTLDKARIQNRPLYCRIKR